MKEITLTPDNSDDNEKLIDAYDYLANAASAHDCTGLIPSEPLSQAERESYEDLYEYQYKPFQDSSKSSTDKLSEK